MLSFIHIRIDTCSRPQQLPSQRIDDISIRLTQLPSFRYLYSLIILLHKLLDIHLLPLLGQKPIIVLVEDALEELRLFVPIYCCAHPVRNLRRHVIPKERLLSLIGNLVIQDIVQVLYRYHILQIPCILYFHYSGQSTVSSKIEPSSI